MNLIFRFADDDFWYQIRDKVGIKGGAYLLFSRTDSEKQPQPVNRLLGVDTKGFLYIGKADSYLDRVIELKKSLSPDHKSSGHECGARWKKHKGIRSKFPYETLHISLFPSENPFHEEKRLLEEYLESYGELPPLNRVS